MKRSLFCFAALLLGMSLTLCGAEKFQVTYLKGPSEPKMFKVTSLENRAAVFAKQLSMTLRKEVKVVPFEKADAEMYTNKEKRHAEMDAEKALRN